LRDRTGGRPANCSAGPACRATRCALDALLAVIALDQPRPVVLLTSDPGDPARLTEEPGRPRAQRVKVARV
jgi:hypothetical protein